MCAEEGLELLTKERDAGCLSYSAESRVPVGLIDAGLQLLGTVPLGLPVVADGTEVVLETMVRRKIGA